MCRMRAWKEDDQKKGDSPDNSQVWPTGQEGAAAHVPDVSVRVCASAARLVDVGVGVTNIKRQTGADEQ